MLSWSDWKIVLLVHSNSSYVSFRLFGLYRLARLIGFTCSCATKSLAYSSTTVRTAAFDETLWSLLKNAERSASVGGFFWLLITMLMTHSSSDLASCLLRFVDGAVKSMSLIGAYVTCFIFGCIHAQGSDMQVMPRKQKVKSILLLVPGIVFV